MLQWSVAVVFAFVISFSSATLAFVGEEEFARQLAVGDFNSINDILRGTTFSLPPMSRREDGTTLRLSQIRCRNVQIGDAQFQSSYDSALGMGVILQVVDLDLICDARYNYDGRLLNGSGDVTVISRNNDVLVRGLVEQEFGLGSSSSISPPRSIIMSSCNPSVQINEIDFDNGGFLGWVLNLIERLARGIMENLVEDLLCQELSEALQRAQEILEEVNIKLEQYPTAVVVDPLQAENALFAEEGDDIVSDLLDLIDPETDIGGWTRQAIEQATDYLQAVIETPGSAAASDMRANEWIRDFFLDEEQSLLAFDASKATTDSWTIFYNHDNILETAIQVEKVQIRGLDTLTYLNPLDIIGSLTIESQVEWAMLSVEVDASITIKPSSLDNAVVNGDEKSTLMETFSVVLSMRDIKASLSLLMALQQSKAESLPLGSLLSTSNLLPCMASTFRNILFSTFTIETSDIFLPYISPIESDGLYRILNEVLDVSFQLYEDIMLEKMPALFHQDIRELFNEYILAYINDPMNACPIPRIGVETNAPESFVDFRDLLLNPFNAWWTGGMGTEPYGDLIPSVLAPNLESQLMSASQFNERVVGTMTKLQSGTLGSLHWIGTMFEASTTESTLLYDAVVFHLSNLRLENLDTVKEPFSILDAQDWNLLQQNISAGSLERPLNVTVSVLLAVGDENSPLSMTNQWDVSIEIPSISLDFGVFAHMKEKYLVEFPIGDILNPYCWLSTLSSQVRSYEADVLNFKAFALDTAITSLPSLRLGANCVSCSSLGADFLGVVLKEDLPFSDFYDLFSERIGEAIGDFALYYSETMDIEDFIEEAKIQCPHRSSEIDTLTFTETKNPFLRNKALENSISKTHADTIFGLGMVSIHLGLAIGAQNHLLKNVEGAKETESSVFNPDLIDWTDLSSSLGEWADFMFAELHEFISVPVEDSLDGQRKPRLLKFLDEHIFNEGAVSFNKIGGGKDFEMFGMRLSLSTLSISGVDTLSNVDLIQPTEHRHVLKNCFDLDNITLAINGTLSNGIDVQEQFLFTYSLKNISFEIDVLAGVDLRAIQELQIGSIFKLQDIFSCATSGLAEARVVDIKISSSDISGPVLSQVLDPFFESSLRSVTDALSRRHNSNILAALPIFFNTTVKEITNTILPGLLDESRKNCPSPPYYSPDNLVDFRELLLSPMQSIAFGGRGTEPYGNVFEALYTLLVENILKTDDSNRPVINDIFRHISHTQSNINGTIFVQEPYSSSTDIKIAGLEATVGLGVTDVLFENIDSVGHPLELFNPVFNEAHLLSNQLSFGVDGKPMSIAATIHLSISDGDEMDIQNKLRLGLKFTDVEIFAKMILKISERTLSNFSIGSIDDINCWMATLLSQPAENGLALRGIGLQDHAFSIGDFSFTLACQECSSPEFDKLLLSLYNFDTSEELEEAIRQQLDDIFRADSFNFILDELFALTAKRCPDHAMYDPESRDFFLNSSVDSSLEFLSSDSNNNGSAYFNAAMAGLILFLGIIAKRLIATRNRKWVESCSQDALALFRRQQEKEQKMQSMLDSETHSLFRSQDISKRIRFGVPIVIFINIGLYLGGHLGSLSVVNIDAAVAGQEFTVNTFLEFRFLEATKASFANGGAEMAVLLWIFTGIWPYVKLIGSLLLWVLPPSILSIDRRGRLLLWIDVLAKLSVIDIFTMLLGFAVMLVFIGGPDKSLSESGTSLYGFKAIVVPKAGFYCLIIAQRISRVSSRFLLECHDQLIERSLKAFEEGATRERAPSFSDPSNDDAKDDDSCEILDSSLQDEHSISDGTVKSDKDFERRRGATGVFFGGITVLIIFVIGCILAPSFSLDTSSLANLAAESGMTYEEAISEYGVFLVISSVLVKTRFVLDTKADYVGLGFLLFAGFISAAFVFLMQTYQFLKRQWKKHRIGVVKPLFGHVGCGLPNYLRLYKWASMEIFVIAFAIGVWQLGSACAYAIHLYCDILRQIYTVLEFFALMDESSANCSRVQAFLPINIIIAGGSFLILLISFFFQARNQCKKNESNCLRFVNEDEVPNLSLAWSDDRCKNSRYSHLTVTLSSDECSKSRSEQSNTCTHSLMLLNADKSSHDREHITETMGTIISVQAQKNELQSPSGIDNEEKQNR